MATLEATQQLNIQMMGSGTRADCTQCGKPARAYVSTEQGRLRVCSAHLQLALTHFATAHGLKWW